MISEDQAAYFALGLGTVMFAFLFGCVISLLRKVAD